MSRKVTTTLADLLHEVRIYQDYLPVFIRVGEQEYEIDDIFLCVDENSHNSRILFESWKIETAATMGKKGGRIGGKIGGKAKVPKGFSVSGKSGRKRLTDAQLAELPPEKQTAIKKRRERMKKG